MLILIPMIPNRVWMMCLTIWMKAKKARLDFSDNSVDADEEDDAAGVEADSFVLDEGVHTRKSTARPMASGTGGVEWEDVPRKSTVTINEVHNLSHNSPGASSTVREFLGMSASTPPLQGILAPSPIRTGTPIASILTTENSRSSSSDLPPSSADLPPSSAAAAVAASNAAQSTTSSASSVQTQQPQSKDTATASDTISAVPPTSTPTTPSTTTTSHPTVLGSAFRSEPVFKHIFHTPQLFPQDKNQINSQHIIQRRRRLTTLTTETAADPLQGTTHRHRHQAPTSYGHEKWVEAAAASTMRKSTASVGSITAGRAGV
ncbi:hypothetical protein BDR26DRAFT_41586 [Obelidium mucronatum]|nr:hypothetical protein BDR26DRAFT_41586 [Obelidium mucronatum]